MTLSSEIISTAVQIAVFLLIPFLFFLFRADKTVSFTRYVGLYAPTRRSAGVGLLISVLFLAVGVGLVFTHADARQQLTGPGTVAHRLQAIGLNGTSVGLILLIALLKTSFAEEVFFRGFVAKSLIRKFGFRTGNLVQGLIFGMVHLVLFALMGSIPLVPLVIIFLLTTWIGWTLGVINERHAAGSIVPGWIAHGAGNCLAYFILAFIV
ncbi:MAG TPA: CPBP family intramembrane glutamic endopeptidase [Sphingobacteriaceae bacterium]